MDNKKELREQYKQSKPDMGVFMYKCLPTGKVYLGCGKNVKAEMNSITFQLKFGQYPVNKNLERDWKQHGESAFEVSVLELLQYDEDETKTDYTEDLQALRALCAEQFTEVEYIKK